MKAIIIFLFTAITITSYAQTVRAEKKQKFDSYFGLQFKPLIPGNFLGSSQLKMNSEGFSSTITQTFGYSFGASVRIGITKLISIETGLNQVQRNYNIDFAIPDSNLYAKNKFRVINYDIPINALIYIQLSDKFFMNASLGGSLVYNPTDVATKLALDGGHAFIQEGRRISKVAFETSANFGVEYRTEKSGIFYLGISGRVPIKPIFIVATEYKYQSTSRVAIGNMIGTYVSFDLRYYLPNVKNKGTQFKPGPIEQ